MESLRIRDMAGGGFLPLNLERGVAMTDSVRVDIDAGSSGFGQRSTRRFCGSFLLFDLSFRWTEWLSFLLMISSAVGHLSKRSKERSSSHAPDPPSRKVQKAEVVVVPVRSQATV
jgi:hypothetical protein